MGVGRGGEGWISLGRQDRPLCSRLGSVGPLPEDVVPSPVGR